MLLYRLFVGAMGRILEGQDMWHMSGIHRDVYLVATPKTYLADHYIKSTVTPGLTTAGLGECGYNQ